MCRCAWFHKFNEHAIFRRHLFKSLPILWLLHPLAFFLWYFWIFGRDNIAVTFKGDHHQFLLAFCPVLVFELNTNYAVTRLSYEVWHSTESMLLGMANEKIVWQNDHLEKHRNWYTNKVYDLSSHGLLIKFTEPDQVYRARYQFFPVEQASKQIIKWLATL